MILPKKEHLEPFPDDIEDPVPFYYIPLIRNFYLKRFEMALDFLGEDVPGTILDLGCGSGVVFPELGKRCKTVIATDLTMDYARLSRLVQLENLSVGIFQSNALKVPLSNESVDRVISISLLEHVPGVFNAVHEIHRILKNDGIAIIGVPVQRLLLITFFLLARIDYKKYHVTDYTEVMDAVSKLFRKVEIKYFPFYLPKKQSLYVVLKCYK